MTTFPGSPKLLKGGLVLVSPDSGVVQRIIVLQYNPETLSRTLQAQTVGESGDRSQALRLIGPPQESYKIEATIDAADQMEFPDENQTVRENGILPQLAVLETILYPTSGRLIANNALAGSGTLEIIPAEAPLTLFVWSKNRVMPVRITEFSITEEAFDPNLNPIRAKVSLGLRVLNVNDLGFDHRGGNLYMTYHQRLEQLATLTKSGVLGQLGITGL
ncbi:MAG: hypothetical protein HUU38_02095 [Anaerolineales bacterium]|nr:hypothetical protein [Anaerolineales bacterium]